ncbi:DUF4406 domain-containing protein [Porphyromonas gulae]|uniref:DUF4406 domain-containing protein n=1 Tax=Porphyromonas gulae TaxID=111105 RepID=UPI00068FF139|nr:DUF4406 domain-containing protein [Porphyromonas gulae]
MEKKKMYVSLPITGHPIDEVKETADFVKQNFRHKYEVVTPFDICPEDGLPYSHYMGEDIKVLLECDIVYFERGWHSSKGCRAEYHMAVVYEKEIIMA